MPSGGGGLWVCLKLQPYGDFTCIAFNMNTVFLMQIVGV